MASDNWAHILRTSNFPTHHPITRLRTLLRDVTIVGDAGPWSCRTLAALADQESLTALSLHHGSYGNKDLKVLLAKIGSKLKKLSLSVVDGVSENLFRNLPNGSPLIGVSNVVNGSAAAEALELSNNPCMWPRGAVWELMPNLTCLHLDGCNINDATCSLIAKLSLTELDLSCTKVGDAGVLALSQAQAGQTLQWLRLGCTKVKGLEGLHMPRLTFLDIGASGVHQYQGIHRKSSHHNQQQQQQQQQSIQLEVYYCNQRMATRAVEHIAAGCPLLEKLNLCGALPVKNPSSVGTLHALFLLRELSLGDTFLPEAVIIKIVEGPGGEPNLPHITSLNLSRTKAGDAACMAIGSCCRQLHTLLLAYTALGPSACCLLLGTGEEGEKGKAECHLPKLHTLSCFGTKVDDSSQGAWRTLHSLRWLDLGKTKVGELTCIALAAIPRGQLEALSVGGSVREAHAGILLPFVEDGSSCLIFNLIGGNAMITMGNGLAGAAKEGTIAKEYAMAAGGERGRNRRGESSLTRIQGCPM